MYTSNTQNLTATTTIGAGLPLTTNSLDDNRDMKRVLIYAIPLSCAAIILVLLITVGFRRRRHVLEKWSSLTRMRNTDPRCLIETGLRHDSEYDLCNDGFVTTTVLNDDEHSEGDTDFRLATIS